ncbi:putative PurR-regulated permease PerM [Mumia flava]|uniref:Putative PurR-regulated permease PerM n=1 Tax=Mumia flava TaxID=1348852 RepID=A0A2M9BGH1_9ACTN|nr:AI-2E family transporter [Mumia flava]PJJ57032.1 putative PurR-regulated permease PerM [Mumia flava]
MSHPRPRDRAAVISEGFEILSKWGLRIILIAAGLFVVGWVIGRFWMIGFPVMVALLLATLLAPPATFLRRRGVPSPLAAAVTVVGFVLVIAGTIAVIAPEVAGQAPEIASEASRGLVAVQDWLQTGPFGISEDQLNNAISTIQDWLRDSAAAISAGALSTIGAATGALVNTVLIVVLSFFFVKDGHKFLPWLHRVLGERIGVHAQQLGQRAWDTLGGFIRTQALVSLVDAFFIGLALVILGVPLAVPLAVITFIGGFVPIVGAFVTGALAVLVTLVTNDFRDAVIMLIVIIAVQQLEGNVLSPWLQGRSMNLQAAVILLAVTAGSSLFGITGAFLAVPVTATAAAVLRYLNEQIAIEAGEAPPPDAGPSDSAPPGDPRSPADPGDAATPTSGAPVGGAPSGGAPDDGVTDR